MKAIWTRLAGSVAGTLAVTVALHAQPPAASSPETAAARRALEKAQAESAERDTKRLSVEVARDRAAVMHDIYAATLDVMHHRYFHAERAVVPARAMEDVFSQIQRSLQAEARWIAVNLKPMSLNHKPESPFEKQAAEVLATGKPEFEVVKDGYYRRATPIPLTGGCLSCHSGFFRQQSAKPKYAGLVISIPVHTTTETSKRTGQ